MPDIVNDPTLGMYVAAAVALVVMIGFFIYLWAIDRQVRELDQATRTQEWRNAPSIEASRTVVRPTPIEKEMQHGIDHG